MTPAPIRSWCCRDLAEFVNFVTRVKIVPATADNVAFGETERLRARDFAAKLSMRVLSRMWQMLLKGITEVAGRDTAGGGGRNGAGADRLCADMPTPDEAIRMLEPERRHSSVVTTPVRRRAAAPASGGASMPSSPARPASAPRSRRRSIGPPAEIAPSSDAQLQSEPALRITGFPELVALAGEKRDLLTKGRAGSRCPAGPYRGRAARGCAGAQRRRAPDQRSVPQARTMDRTALDRDRVQRSRPTDAAFAKRSRRRTSASAPRNPIRG